MKRKDICNNVFRSYRQKVLCEISPTFYSVYKFLYKV